jgi:hypothetical protein
MKQKKKLMITFPSTAQAMKMEAHCRREGIPGRLAPVPGSVRAGCGMGWLTEPDQRELLERFMVRQEIDWDGIVELYL